MQTTPGCGPASESLKVPIRALPSSANCLPESEIGTQRQAKSPWFASLAKRRSSTGRHDILLDAIDAAMQAMHQPDQIEIAVAALHALARAAARQGMSLDRAAGVDRLAILRRQLEEILASRTKPSALPDTIGLLSYLPDSEPLLTSLAQPTQDQSIRVAAMGALAKQQGSDPWPPLLDGFSAETPVIRRALVDGLLANFERTKLLLDAIEAGQIKTSELDVAHVNRLTNHRDGGVKQRARELLAAATPQDRAQALADYQPVLQMNGDALRGQAVFEKNCAACHKIGETGVNVAPDISDSRTKTAAQLLTDILQPNRAIDNNYVGYNVRLVDGTVQTGILTAETATSITLRQQGGKDAVIPRSEIEELKSTGQSLMPEGRRTHLAATRSRWGSSAAAAAARGPRCRR
jgi:putative heme-binding domain-containing protein